jgi:hypothetical protein
MAKKFVRGVTGVEDIESYDKTLTNVNDILSDGQDTYIHTKKGKNESYYKLTDSLKSVISDNSDLITVTKDDTTNTATIHPKHDAQKEQSIESTRGTVSIQKGGNGTSETTKVDTNPQKVLEHNNLLTDYGIRKNTTGNTTKLGIEYTLVSDGFDLNTFTNGYVVCNFFKNSPQDNTWFFVKSFTESTVTYQEAVRKFSNNIKYVRTRNGSVWTDWREQVGDKSVIDALLAQKQDTLTSNASIGVLPNNQLRQLCYNKQTYTHVGNGLLRTHVKSVSNNTNMNTALEEYNFIVKINQNAPSAVFTLNDIDKTYFTKIINTYGSNNTVRISGCVFTLSGSNLTVTTTSNTNQNYVITFSDILD